MTPAEKVRQAADMLEAAKGLLRERVRAEHGDVLTEREVELRVAEHLHGRAFVDAIRQHEASR